MNLTSLGTVYCRKIFTAFPYCQFRKARSWNFWNIMHLSHLIQTLHASGQTPSRWLTCMQYVLRFAVKTPHLKSYELKLILWEGARQHDSRAMEPDVANRKTKTHITMFEEATVKKFPPYTRRSIQSYGDLNFIQQFGSTPIRKLPDSGSS